MKKELKYQGRALDNLSVANNSLDKNKMKIILTSIGTIGDMEPFLAIGEIVNEKDEDHGKQYRPQC